MIATLLVLAGSVSGAAVTLGLIIWILTSLDIDDEKFARTAAEDPRTYE